MGTVHLVILLLTVSVIVYADHYAFVYLRGTRPLLNAKRMTQLHIATYVGLAGMITTGIIMVAPYWQYFISNPIFLTKMGFVLVLVVNSAFISHLMHHAYTTPFADLPNKTKCALLVSGAVSTMGWVGAITIGLVYFW